MPPTLSGWVRRAVGAVLVVALPVGCGGSDGDGTTVPPPPPAPTIATVTVNPTSAAIELGRTVQLTATVRDSRGEVVSGRTPTWTSADPSVASVNAEGVVTGVAPGGPIQITGTVDGRSGATSVTVTPRPVVAVRVTPVNPTVVLGQTVQLTATALDADGGELAGRPFIWESSNVAVASVSSSGLVTGVSVGGPVVIGATSEGRRGSTAVTVIVPPVASVTVSPASASLTPGQIAQLTAMARDADGNTLPDRAIAWTTSNAAVATTSSSGLVTAVALGGPATITATSEGRSGTASITVIAPPTGQLGCGALLSGSIAAPGEVDVITMPGQVNALVSLTLVNTAGFPFRAARATLVTPGGAQLRVFDANTQQDLTLPVTGTYTIRLTANDLVTTGSYNIGMECLLPAGPVDGTLQSGSLASASVDRSGKVDLYTLAGQANQLVSLTVVNTSGFPFRAARVTLFSPSGTLVRSFDANSQVDIALPVTGTYLLRVNANDLVTIGSYNLGVESLVPLGPVDGALVAGGLLAGSIDRSGKVDLYTLAGQANALVSLTLVNTAGFPFRAARATLFTTSGTAVRTFDANSQQDITLPVTGTYVLRVNANDLVTGGSYHLGLEALLPLGPTDGVLACGGLLPGSIDQAGKVDLYTIGGQANAQVTITLVNTAGFPFRAARATVLSPTGALVVQFDANSQRTITLPAAGTYVVRINANDLVTTGSYNVGLTC